MMDALFFCVLASTEGERSPRGTSRSAGVRRMGRGHGISKKDPGCFETAGVLSFDSPQDYYCNSACSCAFFNSSIWLLASATLDFAVGTPLAIFT